MSTPTPPYPPMFLSFPLPEGRKKRLKSMSDEMIKSFSQEVKALLHAHRDAMRNCGDDTAKWRFRVNEGWYGEAFGVIRGLAILGYGYLGSDYRKRCTNFQRPEQELMKWFRELENEVLDEENFQGTGRCEYCLERYSKDDKSVRDNLSREEVAHV